MYGVHPINVHSSKFGMQRGHAQGRTHSTSPRMEHGCRRNVCSRPIPPCRPPKNTFDMRIDSAKMQRALDQQAQDYNNLGTSRSMPASAMYFGATDVRIGEIEGLSKDSELAQIQKLILEKELGKLREDVMADALACKENVPLEQFGKKEVTVDPMIVANSSLNSIRDALVQYQQFKLNKEVEHKRVELENEPAEGFNIFEEGFYLDPKDEEDDKVELGFGGQPVRMEAQSDRVDMPIIGFSLPSGLTVSAFSDEPKVLDPNKKTQHAVEFYQEASKKFMEQQRDPRELKFYSENTVGSMIQRMSDASRNSCPYNIPGGITPDNENQLYFMPEDAKCDGVKKGITLSSNNEAMGKLSAAMGNISMLRGRQGETELNQVYRNDDTTRANVNIDKRPSTTNKSDSNLTQYMSSQRGDIGTSRDDHNDKVSPKLAPIFKDDHQGHWHDPEQMNAAKLHNQIVYIDPYSGNLANKVLEVQDDSANVFMSLSSRENVQEPDTYFNGLNDMYGEEGNDLENGVSMADDTTPLSLSATALKKLLSRMKTQVELLNIHWSTISIKQIPTGVPSVDLQVGNLDATRNVNRYRLCADPCMDIFQDFLSDVEIKAVRVLTEANLTISNNIPHMTIIEEGQTDILSTSIQPKSKDLIRRLQTRLRNILEHPKYNNVNIKAIFRQQPNCRVGYSVVEDAKLVAFVFLDDLPSSGFLRFPALGVRLPPQKGSAVVFENEQIMKNSFCFLAPAENQSSTVLLVHITE